MLVYSDYYSSWIAPRTASHLFEMTKSCGGGDGWGWGDHILKRIFRGSTQHVRLQDDFVKFIKIALTFSVFTFCAFSSLRGPACIASKFPGSWDIIRKRCVDSAHDPITLEIVCSNDVLRYNNNCRAASLLWSWRLLWRVELDREWLVYQRE